MPPRLRLVLVSDDPSWEHALGWLLRSLGLDVVALGRDVSIAPTLVNAHVPDLLVVDCGPPTEPERVWTSLHRSHRLCPYLVSVVVTDHTDGALRECAVAGGASRVVERADAQAVLQALESSMLLARRHATQATPTRREAQILRLLAGGCTNQQAARALWLSEHTVKYHLGVLYRRLGVHTRSQALAWAAACGLVAPPRRDLPPSHE